MIRRLSAATRVKRGAVENDAVLIDASTTASHSRTVASSSSRRSVRPWCLDRVRQRVGHLQERGVACGDGRAGQGEHDAFEPVRGGGEQAQQRSCAE